MREVAGEFVQVRVEDGTGAEQLADAPADEPAHAGVVEGSRREEPQVHERARGQQVRQPRVPQGLATRLIMDIGSVITHN